jgi:hypothetical protein
VPVPLRVLPGQLGVNGHQHATVRLLQVVSRCGVLVTCGEGQHQKFFIHDLHQLRSAICMVRERCEEVATPTELYLYTIGWTYSRRRPVRRRKAGSPIPRDQRPGSGVLSTPACAKPVSSHTRIRAAVLVTTTRVKLGNASRLTRNRNHASVTAIATATSCDPLHCQINAPTRLSIFF